MASKIRVNLRIATGAWALPAHIENCKTLDPQLATAISTNQQLTIISYWGRQELNVLYPLYVASGGGPTFKVLPIEGEDREFLTQHEACQAEQKALVVEISKTRQLILAAVESALDNGQRQKLFWGFICAPSLPSVVTELLDRSQLALILDLDETLLVAHSASSIENRMSSCRQARSQVLMEITSRDATLTQAERERLEANAAALQKEEELLAQDADLIKQFTHKNSVTINGKMFTPRLEPAHLEDGSVISRPVIRLRDGLVVLTRIDPNERKTSMLLRVRPGWEDMRKYLAGEVDAKQRFAVYVCTAAERQYALEVWRLLDTAGNIIPQEKRRERIVNVSGGRKKTVLNSLGIMDSYAAIQAGAELADIRETDGVLPLAVVVDDRLEVWEEADQANILQVMPWFYYKDEAARQTRINPATAAFSEKELVRVRNAIVHMRGEVYQVLDQVVKPALDKVRYDALPDADPLTGPDSVLPNLRTPATLLKEAPWLQVYGLPRFSTSTPPPEDPGAQQYAPLQAAALALPSLKPKDPRAAGAARTARQASAPSLKPNDPRKAARSEPQPQLQQAGKPQPVIANPDAWNLSAMAGAMDEDEEDFGARAMTNAPAAVHSNGPLGPRHLVATTSVPVPVSNTGVPEQQLVSATPEMQQAPATVQPNAAAPNEALLRGFAKLIDIPDNAEATLESIQYHLKVQGQLDKNKGELLTKICEAVVADATLLPAAAKVIEAYKQRPVTAPKIVEFLQGHGGNGLALVAEALQVKQVAQGSGTADAGANGQPAADADLQRARAQKRDGSFLDSDQGDGGPPPSKRLQQQQQHPNARGGQPTEFPGQFLPAAGPPQPFAGNPSMMTNQGMDRAGPNFPFPQPPPFPPPPGLPLPPGFTQPGTTLPRPPPLAPPGTPPLGPAEVQVLAMLQQFLAQAQSAAQQPADQPPTSEQGAPSAPPAGIQLPAPQQEQQAAPTPEAVQAIEQLIQALQQHGMSLEQIPVESLLQQLHKMLAPQPQGQDAASTEGPPEVQMVQQVSAVPPARPPPSPPVHSSPPQSLNILQAAGPLTQLPPNIPPNLNQPLPPHLQNMKPPFPPPGPPPLAQPGVNLQQGQQVPAAFTQPTGVRPPAPPPGPPPAPRPAQPPPAPLLQPDAGLQPHGPAPGQQPPGPNAAALDPRQGPGNNQPANTPWLGQSLIQAPPPGWVAPPQPPSQPPSSWQGQGQGPLPGPPPGRPPAGPPHPQQGPFSQPTQSAMQPPSPMSAEASKQSAFQSGNAQPGEAAGRLTLTHVPPPAPPPGPPPANAPKAVGSASLMSQGNHAVSQLHRLAEQRKLSLSFKDVRLKDPPRWESTFMLAGQVIGIGSASHKADAKQLAAKQALEKLNSQGPQGPGAPAGQLPPSAGVPLGGPAPPGALDLLKARCPNGFVTKDLGIVQQAGMQQYAVELIVEQGGYELRTVGQAISQAAAVQAAAAALLRQMDGSSPAPATGQPSNTLVNTEVKAEVKTEVKAEASGDNTAVPSPLWENHSDSDIGGGDGNGKKKGGRPLQDPQLLGLRNTGVITQLEYATLLRLLRDHMLLGAPEKQEAKRQLLDHYVSHVRKDGVPDAPGIRQAVKQWLQSRGLVTVAPTGAAQQLPEGPMQFGFVQPGSTGPRPPITAPPPADTQSNTGPRGAGVGPTPPFGGPTTGGPPAQPPGQPPPGPKPPPGAPPAQPPPGGPQAPPGQQTLMGMQQPGQQAMAGMLPFPFPFPPPGMPNMMGLMGPRPPGVPPPQPPGGVPPPQPPPGAPPQGMMMPVPPPGAPPGMIPQGQQLPGMQPGQQLPGMPSGQQMPGMLPGMPPGMMPPHMQLMMQQAQGGMLGMPSGMMMQGGHMGMMGMQMMPPHMQHMLTPQMQQQAQQAEQMAKQLMQQQQQQMNAAAIEAEVNARVQKQLLEQDLKKWQSRQDRRAPFFSSRATDAEADGVAEVGTDAATGQQQQPQQQQQDIEDKEVEELASRERDRERDRDQHRGRDRDRHKDYRERDRGRDRERDRDSGRRGEDKDRERDSSRERDRERDRDGKKGQAAGGPTGRGAVYAAKQLVASRASQKRMQATRKGGRGKGGDADEEGEGMTEKWLQYQQQYQQQLQQKYMVYCEEEGYDPYDPDSWYAFMQQAYKGYGEGEQEGDGSPRYANYSGKPYLIDYQQSLAQDLPDDEVEGTSDKGSDKPGQASKAGKSGSKATPEHPGVASSPLRGPLSSATGSGTCGAAHDAGSGGATSAAGLHPSSQPATPQRAAQAAEVSAAAPAAAEAGDSEPEEGEFREEGEVDE